MKKVLTGLTALAAASALLLTGCGSGDETSSSAPGNTTSESPDPGANAGKTIKLWLAGGDTNDELRDYLKTTFNEKTGATLVIEEQGWGDLVTKLTTSLPDANNTPDVAEMGNTQSPTFTNVGAFLDISDMYEELGGDKLLQGFVEAGKVDGKNYTLPYYFGSRYVFYRKDIWKAAGVEVPTTLAEFDSAVATIAKENPKSIDKFSGFYLGGQDWRNGISWIFANGGDIATNEGGTWKATLDSPESLKGLQQLQELYKNASNAPNDAKDANQYQFINDSDEVKDEDGKVTDKLSLSAATIMAPGWAHWSIGDLVTGDDGQPAREWNDDTFGVFALPGVDGGAAPVFAGGSNIGISATSKEPELAKELMRIIFSAEYQNMLGAAGLGPANSDYVSSLGDDQFAQALIESAQNAKLTPAAPGWAAIESQNIMEEFFAKIRDAKDLTALAQEYNGKLDALLNLK
ncbi:sugar ABC transporter substrate-binding protein [Rarobacter faecitabidus]|uniref:Carbohydrate ABC transporter substrate-binding protein (CUT1 family) n=1 Tax=Rarobacter faecitabidus TaxID=13243 RepID=A0A542ZX00_RARFA|nr:extracellular solute-binding protein [Rarobacter faecitabidus]TQL64881.1 carbohydrate ABC transporter substrate-binding protein (CUT1 family) [Rarobacter faecitabidus]